MTPSSAILSGGVSGARGCSMVCADGRPISVGISIALFLGIEVRESICGETGTLQQSKDGNDASVVWLGGDAKHAAPRSFVRTGPCAWSHEQMLPRRATDCVTRSIRRTS